MTGGKKKECSGRCEQPPVHNQPNLCRVVRRLARDNLHELRLKALLSVLEMSINEVEKRD